MGLEAKAGRDKRQRCGQTMIAGRREDLLVQSHLQATA
jgi:hypothetical protein